MSRTIMPKSTLESMVAPLGRLPRNIPSCLHHPAKAGMSSPAIDAVDVGQEDVAGGAGDVHVVLQVQGQLKIVAPVAPVYTVVGQDRVVFQKDAQALKILV